MLSNRQAKDDHVLLHRCFNQHGGQRKKGGHCLCERLCERLPRSLAEQLIEKEQADWLLVWSAKKKDWTPSKLAIVSRYIQVQIGEHTSNGDHIIAVQDRDAVPDYPEYVPGKSKPAPNRRSKKNERFKADIQARVRRRLDALIRRSVIPEQIFTDEDLGSLFTDPECFYQRFDEPDRVRADLQPEVTLWWDNILGSEGLSLDAGTLIAGADKGCGRLTYVDPETAALIHGHRETHEAIGGRKVKASGDRGGGYWRTDECEATDSAKWVYSNHTDPVDYVGDGEDAEGLPVGGTSLEVLFDRVNDIGIFESGPYLEDAFRREEVDDVFEAVDREDQSLSERYSPSAEDILEWNEAVRRDTERIGRMRNPPKFARTAKTKPTVGNSS